MKNGVRNFDSIVMAKVLHWPSAIPARTKGIHMSTTNTKAQKPTQKYLDVIVRVDQHKLHWFVDAVAEAKAEAKALGLTDKIEIIRIELDPVEF